jgi:hypothetical protein
MIEQKIKCSVQHNYRCLWFKSNTQCSRKSSTNCKNPQNYPLRFAISSDIEAGLVPLFSSPTTVDPLRPLAF